jgi:hypothetical protein
MELEMDASLRDVALKCDLVALSWLRWFGHVQ